MKTRVPVRMLTCATCLLAAVVKSAVISKDSFIQQTKQRCSEDYKLYFDHGTENCEQCREICDHADILGTQQQCQDNCPQYLESLECAKKEDEFYDDGVNHCSPCSEICEDHRLKRTTEDCQTKCSAYMAKQTPEQVPSSHKQNSLLAVNEEGETAESSPFSLHPGWIAAISIGSLAVVCVTIVVVVLVKTCAKQQYQPAAQDEGEGGRGRRNEAAKPVEETSQADSSPHFAIPDARRTGFSELMGDGGSRFDSQRPVLS